MALHDHGVTRIRGCQAPRIGPRRPCLAQRHRFVSTVSHGASLRTGTVASMAVVNTEMQPAPAGVSAVMNRDVDLGATLGVYRHGRSDPTTWIDRSGRGHRSSGRFVRATWTPDGPGTVLIRWAPDHPVQAETWGPGASWLHAQVPALIGDLDPGCVALETDEHPAVAAACTAHRFARFGASATLYHELLPTILQQRITAVEAKRQWMVLCRELSDPAPGPFTGLLLPPAPEVLRRQPSWWFHPHGVERKRAEPMIEVARHSSKFWEWAALGPSEAARLLRLIPGIGAWTTGCVTGPALGDTDAVPVGDFHVKNIIGWNLASEARATDERMLALLAPYAGQRGRVVRSIITHGRGAPKFGPKQRIVAMSRW